VQAVAPLGSSQVLAPAPTAVAVSPPAFSSSRAVTLLPQPPPETIPLGSDALVTLRPRGSALIELTLDRGQLPESAVVEVERRPEGTGSPRQDHFAKGEHSIFHTTTLGPMYLYRARAGGEWSAEISVRVPVPTSPPQAPAAVHLQAANPYVARVTWQADESDVAGFELQWKKDNAFTRIALANPYEREFVLHGRIPGQNLTVRVRAFNARGASSPSEPATVTMPTEFEPGPLPPLGRCEPGLPKPSKKPRGCGLEINPITISETRTLYDVPSPRLGCTRRLMGDYQGCLRLFGTFELQAQVVPVPDGSDEGWPLLLGVAGAGEYVGGQIWTIRFHDGRYLNVDEALYCGERWPEADELRVGIAEDEDPTQSTPPFEKCQVDYPF
jgi:hypothetical protein